MSSSVIHVFYDVPMGYSFKSLKGIMLANANREHLKKGECAVFLNASWMACKILTPGDALLYYRSTVPLTAQIIRFLPTMIGAPRLNYGGRTEASLNKEFESRFKAQMKALKVAFA